jgi:hypothetical protein
VRPPKTPKEEEIEKGREAGRTLDDDLNRPFLRPGNQRENDKNNFNFDNENKDITENNNNQEEVNKKDNTGGQKVNDDNDKIPDDTNQMINYDESERSAAENAERELRQKGVRDAYLHAWKSYERYAFGMDELQPPHHKGKDWLGTLPSSRFPLSPLSD